MAKFKEISILNKLLLIPIAAIMILVGIVVFSRIELDVTQFKYFDGENGQYFVYGPHDGFRQDWMDPSTGELYVQVGPLSRKKRVLNKLVLKDNEASFERDLDMEKRVGSDWDVFSVNSNGAMLMSDGDHYDLELCITAPDGKKVTRRQSSITINGKTLSTFYPRHVFPMDDGFRMFALTELCGEGKANKKYHAQIDFNMELENPTEIQECREYDICTEDLSSDGRTLWTWMSSKHLVRRSGVEGDLLAEVCFDSPVNLDNVLNTPDGGVLAFVRLRENKLPGILADYKVEHKAGASSFLVKLSPKGNVEKVFPFYAPGLNKSITMARTSENTVAIVFDLSDNELKYKDKLIGHGEGIAFVHLDLDGTLLSSAFHEAYVENYYRLLGKPRLYLKDGYAVYLYSGVYSNLFSRMFPNGLEKIPRKCNIIGFKYTLPKD